MTIGPHPTPGPHAPPGRGFAQAPVTWENHRFAAQLGPDAADLPNWTLPAAPSGVVPLRPLGFSDILAGAFRAVRFNPPATMGAAFVVSLTGMLVVTSVAWAVAGLAGFRITEIDQAMDDLFTTDYGLIALSGASWFTAAGMALVTLCLTPMLAHVVCEGVAARRVPLNAAFRHLLRRLPAALAFGGLILVVIGAATGLMAAVVVTATADPDLRMGISVFLVVAGLAVSGCFAIKLAFTLPVIGVEGVGAIAAIRRSWVLTRHRFWRTFGITALTGFIIQMAAGTVQYLLMIVTLVFSFTNPMIGVAGLMLTSLFASALTLPLFASVTSLVYTDARMRDEGLDLAITEELAR